MLLIILSLLQIPLSFAQSEAKAAPIVLQKDQAGRPFYIDKDGDKIIIIDYKSRKDLQDLTKYQHSEKRFDDTKSFYKESVQDVKIISSPKATYKTYTIQEGDTWESISLKLYGVDNRWPQLKVWNENLLINVTLPAGAEMKYIEDRNK
jgi:nucleoid-associated protein YgaU